VAAVKTLSDTLRGAAVNASKWTETLAGSMTSTYDSTGAAFNFPASSTSSTAGQLLGAGQLDLTGSDITVHVVTAPSAGTSADATVALMASGDANNRTQWIYEGGLLAAQIFSGGTKQYQSGTISYSASTQWLRIRESGGTTFFDTSADGRTWTNQFSNANLITVTAVQVRIQGACFQNETNPGTFKFDLYNIFPDIMPNVRAPRTRRPPRPPMRLRRSLFPTMPGRVYPSGLSIGMGFGTPTLRGGVAKALPSGLNITMGMGAPKVVGSTIRGLQITMGFGVPTVTSSAPSGAGTAQQLDEDSGHQLLEDGSIQLLETGGIVPPPPPPPPPPPTPGDRTTGPTIRLSTARALVIPHQVQRWVLPIICTERVAVGPGHDAEFQQNVAEIREFFLALRRAGTPVVYQEGDTRHLVVVRDVAFPDGQVTRWGSGRNGLQGVLLVTIDSTEA
jgi:hypothetical protein